MDARRCTRCGQWMAAVGYNRYGEPRRWRCGCMEDTNVNERKLGDPCPHCGYTWGHKWGCELENAEYAATLAENAFHNEEHMHEQTRAERDALRAQVAALEAERDAARADANYNKIACNKALSDWRLNETWLHEARADAARLREALMETVEALGQIKADPVTDDALDQAFGLGAFLVDRAYVNGKLALEGKDMPASPFADDAPVPFETTAESDHAPADAESVG